VRRCQGRRGESLKDADEPGVNKRTIGFANKAWGGRSKKNVDGMEEKRERTRRGTIRGGGAEGV